MSTSEVKHLISKICVIANNKRQSASARESYPFSLEHVPYASDDGTFNRVNRRFSVVENAGYVSAWTGLRDVRVQNYRTHYPEYSGTRKPLNLSFFKKIFNTLPDARSHQQLTFFVTKDGEIIVDCYIDLSMGISQDGSAGGHLSVEYDKFLAEYERLSALASKRGGGGDRWRHFRIEFEHYVKGSENFEMYQWWGNGYHVEELDDIPF